MVLSVIGTFVEGGSILQKVLFLIGASFLITTAFYNKQKMFVALQAVILVGAVLGFFPAVHTGVKFWLMASSAVVAVAYLVSGKYFKTDPWGIAGSLGLFCIALGFAMNAEQSPSLFYALLLGGGLFVALYSGVQFFYYRVRISMLWLILNVVFAINPLFYLLGI